MSNQPRCLHRNHSKQNGDNRVAIRLPTPLSHLSNTLGRATTYLLSESLEWHHLHDEWRTQAYRHRVVSCRIHPLLP